MERLTGAGVYYYAPMSEAFSYRDGNIYIVGGASSAGQAAMYFSKFARQVTMLVRGEALSDSMSQYLEDQIAATKNIEVRLNSGVIAVEGADRCETITIQNNQTRATEQVSASALLIYAGAVPHTDWTNLIDNAIHAVNGTGKICIGTSLEDNQLVVEIVDNGSGIPHECAAASLRAVFHDQTRRHRHWPWTRHQ